MPLQYLGFHATYTIHHFLFPILKYLLCHKCNPVSIPQVSCSYSTANKVLNGLNSSLFCQHQFETRSVNFFFPSLFFYFFKKSKHLYLKKHAVKAAKSNHLHLCRIRSKPPSKDSLQKMPLGKLS